MFVAQGFIPALVLAPGMKDSTPCNVLSTGLENVHVLALNLSSWGVEGIRLNASYRSPQVGWLTKQLHRHRRPATGKMNRFH